MSAPKPKVYRKTTLVDSERGAIALYRWTWLCGCGARSDRAHGWVPFEGALDSAVAHSYKHATQRLVNA